MYEVVLKWRTKILSHDSNKQADFITFVSAAAAAVDCHVNELRCLSAMIVIDFKRFCKIISLIQV